MKLDVVDNSIQSEWNQFVAGADHHFFHHFEWATIFKEAYGFEPLYLAVRDEQDELLAVYPLFFTRSLLFGRSLKSFPYHVEGGAVFRPDVTDKRAIYDLIVRKILTLQTELRVRNIDIKFSDSALFDVIPDNQIRVYQNYYRYVVDISIGEEELFRRFRQDVRNNTRRAKKFGVVTEISDTPETIGIFNDLYFRWAKGIGLPGHSEKFFNLIWETFYPRGMVKVAIAHLEGNIVAAKMFLVDPTNKYVLQNWGVIRNFELKKYQVNTALHWQEIQWSTANGYRTFDFGVTSQHHEGSNYFKSAWNTEKIPLFFCNIGDFSRTKDRDDHNAGKLFRVFWKRTPLPVVKHVGPYILKQGN